MLDKNKIESLNRTKEPGFTICGCCYKQFIKPHGNIYKVTHKGKTYHLCSYSCYNKVKQWKENESHENK